VSIHAVEYVKDSVAEIKHIDEQFIVGLQRGENVGTMRIDGRLLGLCDEFVSVDSQAACRAGAPWQRQ
jgi:hypothetical protein